LNIRIKKNTRILGAEAEAKAADFLRDKGYEIIQSNYRYRRGEIDIIAKHSGLLIFVEVKARKSNRFGEPESFVDSKKHKMIIETADQYINENNWQRDIRFDVISVCSGEQESIEHFPDAFH
jgi:putative endonuclease